uniref:Ig-like domain-containing protein n=1 Tax=Scleropages formosus TaxID=113540 RepID=A0A8C9S788_SCLFO
MNSSCEWEQQVVGAPGSDVILPCSFPCSDRENLHDVVVSWQCNGTVVVHSYHDSQDQEHSQSAAYRGRTHLFHDQLLKGNGSLHLKSVQKSDQGWYKCEVFSVNGNTKMLVFLLVAAPYEEPQLSIYVGCGSVNINVTTSRGFPQPVLLWRDETESDITNHSQTRVESDRWGCLEVQNELSLPLNDTKTLTVEMTLEVLNQTVSRSLTNLNTMQKSLKTSESHFKSLKCTTICIKKLE